MTEILTPTQLAAEGQALYEQSQHEKAARAFLAAAAGYAKTDAPLSEAEMRNNACVAWLQAGQGSAALQAVEGTPAVFAAGGDLRRQGMALGNLAAALEALQRLPEAIDIYQQSADVLGQCGEEERRAFVLKSLSALHLRAGRHCQALASMKAGLDGLSHPTISQRMLRKLLQTPMNLLKP